VENRLEKTIIAAAKKFNDKALTESLLQTLKDHFGFYLDQKFSLDQTDKKIQEFSCQAF